MKQRLFYISLLLVFCQVIHAQGGSPTEQYLQSDITEKPFDKAAWLEAKEGIDFKDEVRVSREDEDFFDEDNEENKTVTLDNDGGSGQIFSLLFKGLLVIGALALLAYLLNQFLGAGGLSLRRNRKIKHNPVEVNLEKIEAELIESDVDKMLSLALEEGNYPLALRLKYLAIIKGLYLNGYTRWKKDKTNRQYIREIESREQKLEFRKITAAYERVWYGRGEINQSDFKSLEPKFDAFLKTIEANPITTYEPA